MSLSTTSVSRKYYTPVQTATLTDLCQTHTPQEVLAAIDECTPFDIHTLEIACRRASKVQPSTLSPGNPTEFAIWIAVIDKLIEMRAPSTDEATLTAIAIDPDLFNKMNNKNQSGCTLI